MIPVQGPDGKTYNFDQNQAYQLAQRGLASIMQAQAAVNDTPSELEPSNDELTLEQKLTKVEQQFNDMKQEKEAGEQLNRVNQQFNENAAKYELTKNHPGMADIINSSALAYLTLKPGTDVNVLYKNLHDRFNKAVETVLAKEQKKFEARSHVRNLMSPVERSAGTTPAVNDKPRMTAQDLKSGAVKRAFLQQLEDMQMESME